MQLTSEQQEAVDNILTWIERGSPQVFYLGGYAGTGKTTLARHIENYISGRVLYAAYTGKAAYVMRQKGMKSAKTTHSLIYVPQIERFLEADKLQKKLDLETSREEAILIRRILKELLEPKFNLKEDSELEGAKLLVIDEISMINENMAIDLESWGVPILVLGDPGQLPPIKDTGHYIKDTPDFLLKEIHRQAEGNPIIELATCARRGYPFTYGEHGDSLVINARNVTIEAYLSVDQVLTGKNITRRDLNVAMRLALNKTSVYPSDGEKLICLRNSPDKGLLNGMMFKVIGRPKDMGATLLTKLSSEIPSEPEVEVHIHKAYFDEYEAPGQVELMNWWQRMGAQEFDYGYAITVHKSQGSQWDSVALVDDGFGLWDRLLRKQWLYTGVTRAARQILIATT